jgi:hypothetical protein
MKKRRLRQQQSDDRNFDDPKYIEWRKAVYARDGFRCQMPGCNPPKRRGKIHAHHIRKWADYPSLRFMVSNGVTLCDKCHKRVTGNEESFQAMFSGISNSPSTSDAVDIRLQMLMKRYGTRGETKT